MRSEQAGPPSFNSRATSCGVFAKVEFSGVFSIVMSVFIFELFEVSKSGFAQGRTVQIQFVRLRFGSPFPAVLPQLRPRRLVQDTRKSKQEIGLTSGNRVNIGHIQ